MKENLPKQKYYENIANTIIKNLNKILNKPVKKVGKTVGYCRVSSNKQKDDLERR